jgi:surface polysaccharide O-acyltransferase-like enzyme
MNRNISLDVLKIVLACMVVGIHADFLADITQIGSFLTVNGIFRAAVPIFFIINGFFFYVTYTRGKTLFWLKRVLYLYIFWMTFYAYFWFDMQNISLLYLLKTVLIGYWHLWYLSSLLGAGILVAFLNKMPLKWILTLIAVTFMSGVAIQYLGNYHIIANPTIDKIFNTLYVHRNLIFSALPFFFTGFIINKLELHQKMPISLSLLLAVLGVFLLIGESYFNYMNPLNDGEFDNLISLIVVAPAIFILFVKIDVKGKGKKLALYANGIYFIHLFFLLTLRWFIDFDKTVLTIIVIVLSIMGSYFLIKINKKINFIL